MKARTTRQTDSGFTLLEIMVAVAILASTLVVLLSIVTNNVRSTNHAKMTTAATFLARTKMVEIEDQILDIGFTDNDESKSGTFRDLGYPQFRFDTLIERIELPSDLAQKARDQSTTQTQDSKDPMSMLTGFMGGMMASFIDPVRLGLQESVRKVTVRVLWDEHGRRDQTLGGGPVPDRSRQARPGAQSRRGRRDRDRRLERRRDPGTVAEQPRQDDRGRQVMSRRQPSARAAGFTLIEVMLALAILGFVTTIMWGSFSQTVANKKAIESAQERTHTVRVALMRIVREIEMAYLSASENTALSERRTFFIGSSHGDVDELTFSSFAHQRLRAGLAEGDTSLISYFGERDPDDRRILNLMRRETRRLQAENPSTIAGEAYILCPDVSRLKIQYYDHKLKEWVNEWSTLNASGNQYLPTHVRITLTVIDERGQEVSYSTDARIQMTEKVDYKPVRQ